MYTDDYKGLATQNELRKRKGFNKDMVKRLNTVYILLIAFSSAFDCFF